MRGAIAARNRQVAALVVIWRALGFPLAFQKSLRGSKVRWIGCDLAVSSTPPQHQSARGSHVVT
eukprot:14493330-Heterocapsa_arctica.AAC.1